MPFTAMTHTGKRRTRRRRTTRRRTTRRTRTQANTVARVARTLRKRDPVQYNVGGQDGLGISITPQIVQAFSKVTFDNQQSNLKFCRTSPKIYAKHLQVQMKVTPGDDYNNISLAFIRFKRSGELRNADIGAGGPNFGPVTTIDNRPFLPCQNAAGPYYTQVPLNMTTTAVGSANPFMLNDMWNPKVVEVIKKWNIMVQKNPATGVGVTYPLYKHFDFSHKFNEQWKYSNEAPAAGAQYNAPYNNKNYYLIAWSDSKLAPNAYLSYSYRLSFKDVD